MFVANQFGAQVLTVEESKLLCVPSEKLGFRSPHPSAGHLADADHGVQRAGFIAPATEPNLDVPARRSPHP